ncbi:MAG: carbohydrate binding domain-containing protein [Deltaproteobacteria bacterium]|nr:carbohydrate binding domain-containing protein [Deltaproteobacteria bacterium]
MRGPGAFECACTGHFAGPTCGVCAEGYAGANCESCAAGAHLEDGVCALNRTINACQLQTGTVWGSPGEALTLSASVSTGDMSAAGRQPGVDGRICWREAAIAWPIVYGDLTCANASYVVDQAAGERYAATLSFPKIGLFKFVAAFSGNGGTTWTACDPDGIATATMKPGTATIYNVDNGGFEAIDSPLDRWVADLGLDVEAETDRVHSGGRSVRLTRVSTVNADTDFTAAPIAVAAGKSYTVSMWFLDTDPNARANVVYAFYDAADAPVGATSFGGVYTADQASWQNITRVVVAPTGATRVRISTRIYQQSGGTATGGAVILDDVGLIAAP